MTATQFTVDYFIQKFEAIDESLWCTGSYTRAERRCALGHCGCKLGSRTEEGFALIKFLGLCGLINDGEHKNYQQPTSKARILAALKDVKEGAK